MLAGRPPSSFPQNGLQIEFRDALDVSGGLGDVIEGLLVHSLPLPRLHTTIVFSLQSSAVLSLCSTEETL